MPNGRSPSEFLKTYKPKSEFPKLQIPEEPEVVEPELVQAATPRSPSSFMETYKPTKPTVEAFEPVEAPEPTPPVEALAPAIEPKVPAPERKLTPEEFKEKGYLQPKAVHKQPATPSEFMKRIEEGVAAAREFVPPPKEVRIPEVKTGMTAFSGINLLTEQLRRQLAIAGEEPKPPTTWKEMKEWGKKEFDLLRTELGPEEVGRLEHATGRVASGVASILAGVVESPAIVQTGIEKLAIKGGFRLPGEAPGTVRTPEELEKAYKSPEDRPMYKAGQLLRKKVEEAFPANPVFAESFAMSVLPQGAGSLAGFYLLGGLGFKAGLAPWAAPLLAGSATESANLYLEAKMHGASDEQAFAAWAGGALTGATEAIPVGMALNRFNKVTGGGIRKMLANGFTGTLEEGLQEVVQGIGGNVVAQMTFDQKRAWFENVAEGGGAGGILGFAANVAGTALKIRRLKLAGFKTEAEYNELQSDIKKLDKAYERATPEELAEAAEIFESAATIPIPEGKEDEIEAGITKKKKREAAKAEKERVEEEVAKPPKPPVDKTEEDIVEPVDIDKKEKAPILTEEERVSEAEAKRKIDEHLVETGQVERAPERIRERGAGIIPEEVAAEEEAALKAEEEAEAPAVEPAPIPLVERSSNVIAEADTAVREGFDVAEPLRALDSIGRDLNDAIMRGDISDETQDAMEAVSNKMDELSEIAAEEVATPPEEAVVPPAEVAPEKTATELFREDMARREAEVETRKKEDAPEKMRRFFFAMPEGTVRWTGRAKLRRILEKGVQGKDMAPILDKFTRESKKHEGAPPEGAIDFSSLRHPRQYQEILDELTATEKDLGMYKEPIPEHLEGSARQRHVEVFKYYNVGTVEYEIAMKGGMGMERLPNGKLTSESKSILLQNRKGEDYFDPIYNKDASPVAISEMEEELKSEGVLAPTDDLETILSDRVRGGKKEEGGYRGYPTLETRGEAAAEEDLAEAERRAVEEREAEETEQQRRAAEEAGIDLELWDDASRIFLDSIDMNAEQAVDALMEVEGRLGAAVRAGQEEMEGPRDSVRKMIKQRESEIDRREGGTVGGYFPREGLPFGEDEAPEQAEIPGVEEFQREARLADDRAKLEMIRKAKPSPGAMGESFMRELGKKEAALVKSIAEQERALGLKKGEGQRELFKEEQMTEEEGIGGEVGGYFGRMTKPTEPPAPPPQTPTRDIDPDAPIRDETPAEAFEAARQAQVSREDFASSQEDKLSYPQELRRVMSRLQTEIVSQYTPFRLLQRELYARAAIPLPTMDLASRFELLAGSEGQAKHDAVLFRIDIIDPLAQHYKGKGLPPEQSKEDFNTYLFSKRTEDRMTKAPKAKVVGGWTVDRARKSLQGLRENVGEETYQMFEEIGEKYQEHTNEMLKTMVKAGLLDPDLYNTITEDTDFYAFFKVAKHFKAWDERLESAGGRVANDFGMLQRITGIEEEDVQVVDILGETVKKIWDTRIRAEKNIVKQELWNLESLDTENKWLKRGRPDSYYPVELKPADEVLEQLRLQMMANNPQVLEQQFIKVGRAIKLAEEMGLTFNKRKMKRALGRAEVGGIDKQGRVTLNAFLSEVIAHELAHSFDVAQTDSDGNPITRARNVFGVKREVVQRLSSVINSKREFQNELRELVKYTKLGGGKAYKSSAKERWAEFINLYIHNPKKAKEIAPKWSAYFETVLLPTEKVSILVDKLSEYYQKVDKLPNIKTRLSEYDDKGYLELAIKKAFPSKGRHLALRKGTKIPEGFKRILLRVEGKQVALDVDAELYTALEGLPPRQAGITSKFMSIASQVLKGGATVYNATFMIKNVIFRDPARLALLSKYGINVLRPNIRDIYRFPLDWVQAISSAWSGNFRTPDDRYMRWLKSGAGYSDLQRMLTPDLLEEREDRGVPGTILHNVAKFSSALEQTTKIMGFERGLRLENFDALSPELQQEKLQEIASEVRRYSGSPDFWRHGLRVPKQLSLLFMFFGARVAGVSTDLARLGGKTGYQKEAWANLATFVGLPTLYLALMNHDDEERKYYDKQNDVERHNYYMIPRGIFYLDDNNEKRQEYWRIPKDDTAKIFSAMVESFVRFWKDEDPAEFNKFASDFFEDISPVSLHGDNWQDRGMSIVSSMNPMVKVPVELIFGKNTYFHTDIVPNKMKGWEPKDQRRSTTPPLFVWAGEKLGISPLLIEHLTRGYTAGAITQFIHREPQEGRARWTAIPPLNMFASSSYGGQEKRLRRLIEVKEEFGAEVGERYWEVEARWDEMQNMKPSDMSREIRRIARDDKELAKKIAERRKKKAIGWTYLDGMAMVLGVKDGARAKFISGELDEMDPQFHNKYLRGLRKKKVLTATVWRQVRALQRKKGKENE